MSEAGSEGRGLSPAGAGDARARGAVRVSTPVVLAHLRVLRNPWGCLQRAEEQRLRAVPGSADGFYPQFLRALPSPSPTPLTLW